MEVGEKGVKPRALGGGVGGPLAASGLLKLPQLELSAAMQRGRGGLRVAGTDKAGRGLAGLPAGCE